LISSQEQDQADTNKKSKCYSSTHTSQLDQKIFTLCTSCSAVYCNRSCLWVCLCVWGGVCYHDNSKLCASILTKLGL